MRLEMSVKAKANVASFRPSLFRTLAEECAQPATVKSVEWAYPSSETAENRGWGSTGCWTIQLGILGKPMHAVRDFSPVDLEAALQVARQLPFGWSPITLRVHPEYAGQPSET